MRYPAIDKQYVSCLAFTFILKLDATGDNIAKEEIVKGLVQYISAFEDIMTWQSEN